MINGASIEAISAAGWEDGCIRPLYDSYCFSRLPRLIEASFTGADREIGRMLLGPAAGMYDRVILCLVDAFGWRFFEEYQERYPFLSRFAREGVVTKLTSQFPSTTAAHVTTINTGLPVGESGVYEWFYYEPAVDGMIAPLLFSFAVDRERNTLSRAGITPESIYPASTLYPALAVHGVASWVVQTREFTPSPYGDVVCRGARYLPFATLPEGLASLAETALAERRRSYYYVYYGDVDLAGHRFGPASPQFRDEADACFTALETFLQDGLSRLPGKTLLLVTADHGMVEGNPDRAIYVDEAVPEVHGWLKRNGQGRPLLPAGFYRDLFLHIEPEYVETANARFSSALEGRAEVRLVRDVIAEGFFGSGDPSPAFLARVGDLVILPREGETVWWLPGEHVPRHHSFLGHHGGLSRNEMETVLLALPCG